MVLLPFIGALLQALLPTKANGLSGTKWIALGASIAASLCGVVLVVGMQAQTPDLQAVESLPWVGSYAISYEMGLDGLNVLMVLLVAVVFPILIAAEWNQKVGGRGIRGLLLVLQSAFFGAVCAQDAFLLFFFWGLSALPFYFLIGIWGGEGRERAAFQMIVSSAVGNALVFAALVLIYYSVDPHTFSLHELAGGKLVGKSFEIFGYEIPVSTLGFILVGAGLAVRTPIWPIHGWFSRVGREAPFSVMISLCAVMVPVATYIFCRLSYMLFPDALQAHAGWIIFVGAMNLVLGAVCALSQKSLRSLLAFVSLSELGFLLIGIGSLNPAGVVGAVYQQLVLGMALAGFGLFSGILSERLGNEPFLTESGQRNLGGVAMKAPAIALFAGVFVASLLGIPGLGGFVGHSLLIIGSYALHPVIVLIGVFSILLATFYLFSMYRNIFLGTSAEGVGEFSDLSLRERAYLLPLVAGLLFCGIYPKPLLDLVRPTVMSLLSGIK
jgi:NADH-quinone oxidoreductase subunit M